MRWIDKLERRFGRNFGIPNLMMYVTATMVAVFVMDIVLPVNMTYWLGFNPGLVAQGQIWRVITFAFLPPSNSLIFAFFAFYLYYIFGSNLESSWSTFRFTLYYICGIVGHIIAGFISGGITTNIFLNLSLLLAFATLFPNFQLMLFFILPIKIKYMAYAYWFYLAITALYSIFLGDTRTWMVILFSLINYFLFFGPDIYYGIKNFFNVRKRRKKFNQQNNNSIWR